MQGICREVVSRLQEYCVHCSAVWHVCWRQACQVQPLYGTCVLRALCMSLTERRALGHLTVFNVQHYRLLMLTRVLLHNMLMMIPGSSVLLAAITVPARRPSNHNLVTLHQELLGVTPLDLQHWCAPIACSTHSHAVLITMIKSTCYRHPIVATILQYTIIVVPTQESSTLPTRLISN
jgi:hypothetical protein